MNVNCTTKFRFQENQAVIIADLIAWLQALPASAELKIKELNSGEMGLIASWNEVR